MIAALLIGAALSLAASADAAPTVTFKVQAVPVAGFKNTGNLFGGGATLSIEAQISGTEYNSEAPPLEALDLTLAKGFKVHAAGFPSCPRATLEPTGPGPSQCPSGSAAGPRGAVQAEVAFAREEISESATLEPFYAGSALNFFIFGHEPVLLELLSSIGTGFTSPEGLGEAGPKLHVQLPLLETVPNGPYISLTKLGVKLGSGIVVNAKSLYYLTLPGKCPLGGFLVRAQFTFAAVGLLTQQTVTREYRMPCPRKKAKPGPEAEPEVKKVQFKGSAAGPEVVISGKNLGAAPPSPSYPPAPCAERGSGELFGEALYFEDLTAGWSAGNGGEDGLGSCIGLVVKSWSNSKVALTFGDDYMAIPEWTLSSTDEYELHIVGASSAGEVLYKGKAKP